MVTDLLTFAIYPTGFSFAFGPEVFRFEFALLCPTDDLAGSTGFDLFRLTLDSGDTRLVGLVAHREHGRTLVTACSGRFWWGRSLTAVGA